MNKYAISAGAMALASSAVLAMQPAGIAGQWSQASDGMELVLAPKFKLQPNVGVTWGTNLGGSVGYGSMTRTTIVTDPVPLRVNRKMRLKIEPNGRFDWVMVKAHPETPGGQCIKITRTQRVGQVTRLGNQLRFAIEGGKENWEKTCGGSGEAPVQPATENYAITLNASEMRLTGGPSVWTFKRS
ncbi:hypothetical protein MZO42_08700 [Sphingomonas psychrotolerans]|uniref:Uncharacterized protein n=1 Tax=Sphingomonas psychrotolerans TaxID=1327635 RepID=A0ABU3N5K2_9SPHN|nr:hypothetical protein [Sphingomonas psychrotolerans]MDT8758776.1 hypothetical protein [Sphingomonas psychrotolerans]